MPLISRPTVAYTALPPHWFFLLDCVAASLFTKDCGWHSGVQGGRIVILVNKEVEDAVAYSLGVFCVKLCGEVLQVDWGWGGEQG